MGPTDSGTADNTRRIQSVVRATPSVFRQRRFRFRTGAEQFEESVIAAAARITRGAAPAARAVTLLGNRLPVWGAVTVCAVGVSAFRRDVRPGVAVVASLILGAATRAVVAEALDRERPPSRLWRVHWSGPSFPSRHTTLATLGSGLIADALAPRWPRVARAMRWIPPAAVGLSRIVLGVHWPSDVAAGWAFGTVAVAATRRWRTARDPNG